MAKYMTRLLFVLAVLLTGCGGNDTSSLFGDGSGGTVGIPPGSGGSETGDAGQAGSGGSSDTGGSPGATGGTGQADGGPGDTGGSTGNTGGVTSTGGSVGSGGGGTGGMTNSGGGGGQVNTGGTSTGGVTGIGGTTMGTGGAGTGGSTAVCTFGDTDCQGTTPRSCDNTGNWVSGSACTGSTPVCLGGSCVACTPAATQCSGNVAQVCNANGFWQTSQTCPFVCSGGACTGSCVPTSTKCNGSNVETCDSTGTWVFSQTCPTACNSGSCGNCLSGSVQCNGLNTQSCDGTGTWQTTGTCPYVCSGGSCTGSCVPGSTQCSGTTAQTCNSSGQWADTSTCPYVCSGGACIGSCVPTSNRCSGNTSQTCDSSGNWQDNSACPFVCSGGVCTGVCVPGDTQCSGSLIQTCDSTGQWSSSATCPSLPGATNICQGKACSFSCNNGYADCNASPGCETTLGTTTDCLACGDSCGAMPLASGTNQCTASGCMWKVLATESAKYVTDLTSTGTEVYWGAYNGGTGSVFINKVPTTGGASSNAWTWTGGGGTGAVVNGGTMVAWWGGGASSWGVYQGSTSGGASTQVAAVGTAVNPAQMVVTATDIFWLEYSVPGISDPATYCSYNSGCKCTTVVTTTVKRAPRSGGPATTYTTVPSFLSALAVDASGNLYASNYGQYIQEPGGPVTSCGYFSGSIDQITAGGASSLINRVTIPVGNPVGLPAKDYGLTKPPTVVVVGNKIVFDAGVGIYSNEFMVGTTGGSSKVLSYSTLPPAAYNGKRLLAADTTSFFWQDGNSIYEMSATGTGYKQLISVCGSTIVSIAVDSSAVYWTQQAWSSTNLGCPFTTPAMVGRSLK